MLTSVRPGRILTERHVFSPLAPAAGRLGVTDGEGGAATALLRDRLCGDGLRVGLATSAAENGLWKGSAGVGALSVRSCAGVAPVHCCCTRRHSPEHQKSGRCMQLHRGLRHSTLRLTTVSGPSMSRSSLLQAGLAVLRIHRCEANHAINICDNRCSSFGTKASAGSVTPERPVRPRCDR